MRKRVALAETALVGDLFVATRERNRLERDEGDLSGVVHREPDDRADFFVVDVVDQRGDENDLGAGRVHVLDRLELDVEQVADLAMRVRLVADPVELQIGVAQTGVGRHLRELLVLRELDAVCRRLHGVEAQLPRVLTGLDEVGRHRRLAAGELHRHLPTRLDLHRVVENGLDFVPLQFVDEANLVGVHEAGVAHHVAAVRQVNGENRAAAELDRAAAVIVQIFVVVCADVAAGEVRLDVLEELRVDGHDVFDASVCRTILDHPDFVVALDDRGFDLAHLL